MSMSEDDHNTAQHLTDLPHVDDNFHAESMINLALLDPPRWGWTAVGGIADLLPPHERARRNETKKVFATRRKRQRSESSANDESTATKTDVAASLVAMSALQSTTPSSGSGSNAENISDNNSDLDPMCLEKKPKSVSFGDTNPSAPARHKSNETDHTVQVDPGLVSVPGKNTEDCEQGVEPKEKQKHPDGSSGKAIRIQTHDEEGHVDIYAYHRGREGFEERDNETDQLLHDVEPTDTNYTWDEPNLSTTITITFPLQDVDPPNGTTPAPGVVEEDAKNSRRIRKKPVAKIPTYTEKIQWDLGDPNTPTPMVFATNLAEEFGLSFGQTMDVALSIQNQIADFVRETYTYNPPLTLKDPNCIERPASKPAYPHLYGDIMDTVPGGTSIVRSSRGRSGNRQQHAARQISKHSGNARRRSTEGSVRKETSQSKKLEVVREDEPPLEEKYIEEVRTRMRAFSVADVNCKWQDEKFGDSAGTIEIKKNHICHICHKRSDLCGVFHCRIETHSYCKNHFTSRLGMSIRPTPGAKPPTLEYCPICDVSCECAKCKRRLTALSYEFRRRCVEQGATPETTSFPDLFTLNVKHQSSCVYKGGTTAKRRSSDLGNEVFNTEPPPKRRATVKSTCKPEEPGRNIVEKLATVELPREVRDGVDADMGYEEDYLTIYKPQMSLLKPTKVDLTVWKKLVKEGDSMVAVPMSGPHLNDSGEDGNVDFCHICDKAGSLMCCDFCPRAFHKSCLDGDLRTKGRWECHICVKEKNGMPEDLVDGEEMLKGICVAFHDVQVEDSQENLKNLKLLSMIHEMIMKLIQYDFGYMFREPVNCDRVDGYRDSVKNPMDLGTIGSNLVNGEYKHYFWPSRSWDDVVLAVLKDIELVWHNCFTFNSIGSAIYRMAEVHRRRSISIRSRSFDNFLSDNVKIKLKEYVESCIRERVKDPDEVNGSFRKSRYKISIAGQKKGLSRPVAVLDPDKGVIVKIYSTLKAASQSAEFIKGLGHNCEIPTLFDHTVKNQIIRSKDDPTALLFGYRWLCLDDLRKGIVRCANTSGSFSQNQVLEMVDGQSSYIFLSVEEALAFPGLSGILKTGDMNFHELRRELQGLSPGQEYESPCGIKWRLLSPSNRRVVAKSANMDSSLFGSGISLCQSWKSGNADFRQVDDYIPSNCLFAKEDLVLRRRLVGFDSVEVAFRDWIQACESSPVFPDNEAKTLENFRLFYLDGNRNIDGIIWKSVNHVSNSNQKKSNSDAKLNGIKCSAKVYKDSAKSLDSSVEICQAVGSELLSTPKKCNRILSKDCSVPGFLSFVSCDGSDGARDSVRRTDGCSAQEVDKKAEEMQNGMRVRNGIKSRSNEDDIYDPGKTTATVS